jgi:hypothetical protein
MLYFMFNRNFCCVCGFKNQLTACGFGGEKEEKEKKSAALALLFLGFLRLLTVYVCVLLSEYKKYIHRCHFACAPQ